MKVANPGVQITINRDGSVKAETVAMTGEACIPWIKHLEALTGASTSDSAYTEAYGSAESSLGIQDPLELGGEDLER